jgi:pimeloyl-ACP methyl ester carboxylesterase
MPRPATCGIMPVYATLVLGAAERRFPRPFPIFAVWHGSHAVLENAMRSIRYFVTFASAAAVLGQVWPAVLAGSKPRTVRGRPSAASREAFASVPGARLWFKDTGGSGVLVVFLHAATGSSRSWEYQFPAFTAAGYRVIAYDRRGSGNTTMDPAGSQPGTGADDLQALVDFLGIDRFHLVGTAAGGFVAFDYALAFPRRLRSLVVANSIGGIRDEEYLALGRRLRPPEFEALPPDFRELGPTYRAGNPDGVRRWLELEKTSRPAGPPPAAQEMKHQVTFALLATLQVPTRLLTGGADLYAPPPVMRLSSARIRHAATVVLPDVGHSAYWEQPEIFNRAVLEFIRKH